MAKKRQQPKQHGAYANIVRKPETILTINGTGKREVSRRFEPGLSTRFGIDVGTLDAQAERSMKQGWSARKNPVCPICHIQKSISGECAC
jgi:hypothetical protein